MVAITTNTRTIDRPQQSDPDLVIHGPTKVMAANKRTCSDKGVSSYLHERSKLTRSKLQAGEFLQPWDFHTSAISGKGRFVGVQERAEKEHPVQKQIHVHIPTCRMKSPEREDWRQRHTARRTLLDRRRPQQHPSLVFTHRSPNAERESLFIRRPIPTVPSNTLPSNLVPSCRRTSTSQSTLTLLKSACSALESRRVCSYRSGISNSRSLGGHSRDVSTTTSHVRSSKSIVDEWRLEDEDLVEDEDLAEAFENAVETSETLEEDDEEEEDGDDGFCDSFNEEGSGAAAVEDEDLTDLEDESSFVSKEDDDSSVSSGCSDRAAKCKRGPVEDLMMPFASGLGLNSSLELPPSSPLTPSLFYGVPPSIHFPLPNENYTPLPPSVRSKLRWKFSSITPNVIKSCIARVGFTKCSRGSSWLGYWGKHMRSEVFRNILEHQKVNHFPGTFEIGRKDKLWRNLSRLQARVGKKECDFIPLTFVIPHDLKKLKREWDKGGLKQKWILKPPASARGIGIRLVHKWNQVPKKKPTIVQRYILDPFLINGSKFDLRVYVYVTCYDPLRVYIFKDGLTRFATCKYSTTTKSLSNRFVHLTNYSVNKRNANFTANSDERVCQGHKWGLQALWQYMRSELGIDTAGIWDAIKDLVIKTIISSEASISSLVRAHVKHSRCCHELFGFDIMLDSKLKPWILEVNVSPSLHSNSRLDQNIKGVMVRDILNMAGFRIPVHIKEHTRTTEVLNPEEKTKHLQYLQKPLPELQRQRILQNLMKNDTKVLVETEDEFAHCGSFERIFPSPVSNKYRKFFECERYNNILLEQWIAKYHKNPLSGINLLQKLAKEHFS